jgi:hypothetical protein
MVRRFQVTTMTVMHLESKGMAMVVGKILFLINMSHQMMIAVMKKIRKSQL